MQNNQKKTWKTRLKEFCDKYHYFHSYTTKITQRENHENLFTSKVLVYLREELSYKAIGVGKSVKQAKHEAAKTMLTNKLSPDLHDIIKQFFEGNDNPVGTLNEFCDKKKLNHPVYAEDPREGSANQPVYKMHCKIPGTNVACLGTGKTKKDAKRFAAMECFQQLIFSESGDATPDYSIEYQAAHSGDKLQNKISFPTMDGKNLSDQGTSDNNCKESEFCGKYKTNFLELGVLGRGGFGKVFKARKIFDKTIYAVKRIKLPSEARAKEKVLQEVWALADLNNPNIVRYYDSWIEETPTGWKTENSSPAGSFTPSSFTETMSSANAQQLPYQKRQCLYIQQELCEYENVNTLKEWLAGNSVRNIRQAILCLLDIAGAVFYIHSRNIIHRDLKPSNIFLAKNWKSSGIPFVLKIGDFGLAATTDANALPDSEDSSDTALASSTGCVGTELYASPEQKTGLQKPQEYGSKIDIYPMGIIFLELLYYFETVMEMTVTIKALREENKFPEIVSTEYKDEVKLITIMMSKRPSDRPDACWIESWVHRKLLEYTNQKSNEDEKL